MALKFRGGQMISTASFPTKVQGWPDHNAMTIVGDEESLRLYETNIRRKFPGIVTRMFKMSSGRWELQVLYGHIVRAGLRGILPPSVF